MVNRVFVTRQLPGGSIERLESEYEVDVWEDETPPTQEEIINRAKNCVGLISLLSDRIDRTLIQSLPNLRVIAQYAVGYDNIDVGFATERGITVTNTPGVLTETTADLTWALFMAVARRIPEADKYVRAGNWRVAWGPQMLQGIDVHGATLGIVGLGRIGYAVAKRAVGFNMRILFNSRTSTDLTKQAEKELQAKRVDLDTLLQESDIVSLHVPLTPETNGIISEREFSLMKKDAIIVNTSRGAVIDEKALYDVLKKKRIRGAGLDVFNHEPISISNPLLELDNVVVLPHIGSASIATRTKMADMCVKNLMQAFSGLTPDNIVNPQVLSKLL